VEGVGASILAVPPVSFDPYQERLWAVDAVAAKEMAVADSQ
jgi:hypothetical protein